MDNNTSGMHLNPYLALQAMTNDSDLNMGNNIRKRDTQFISMFWLKTMENQMTCQSNVFHTVCTNNIYSYLVANNIIFLLFMPKHLTIQKHNVSFSYVLNHV